MTATIKLHLEEGLDPTDLKRLEEIRQATGETVDHLMTRIIKEGLKVAHLSSAAPASVNGRQAA